VGAPVAGGRHLGPRRTRHALAGRRRRRTLRSPAVAAVGVVALLSGAGVAAAADWLQVFRTERFAPVEISQADLVALPDLSSYGSLEVVAEPDLREVPDADAAEDATGLDVPEVADLPRGVLEDPEIRVSPEVSAVFTYDAAKAAQSAAASGETLPPAPPGMDGSRFRLQAGPGVASLWSEARGLPAMVVARAVAPTGFSSGVPFERARDYLLSLPGPARGRRPAAARLLRRRHDAARSRCRPGWSRARPQRSTGCRPRS
jgi:hypothetical protein